MTTPLSAEDWIPRDDMATLARKSVDTIKRACKKHDLETGTDESGRVLVFVGDFIDLGLIREQDLTAGATPAESVEVLRARETILKLRTQAAELTGRLTHADTLVETLREQLVTKDRQLAKQADQLTQLIGRLGVVLGGGAV